MRFTAEFSAQAWLSNHALSVDPDGDTTWDVTEHLKMLRPDLRPLVLKPGLERDGLREAKTAPQWVREWSGPFEIELHAEGENDGEWSDIGVDPDMALLLSELPYVDPEAAVVPPVSLVEQLRDLIALGLDLQEARAVLEDSSAEAEDGPAFVVLQEGGSSGEIYASAHSSLEDAEAFRIDCRDSGSYRTSEIFEVPRALARHGEELYTLLEQAARAELDYPEDAEVASAVDADA